MWHHKVTARLARPAAVRSPLTRAAQVSVAPERPSPRETHPRRESNEESPESRRLFGAGLGARSPQRTPRGKHGKANMLAQKCPHASPPTPFSDPPQFLRSLVFRRDRRKETHNPEVNQLSLITALMIRERTTGDPDPRRNRNGTFRKPFCLALCVKQQA